MAGERVLVVDDHLLNRKLVQMLLTSEGYEVTTAADAEEAVLSVATAPPALILMDVQLPGMDGLTLTRVIKADPQTRRILVVALTAYAMKGDAERALEAGCDGYLAKPIDTRTLEPYIAGLLASRSVSPGGSGG